MMMMTMTMMRMTMMMMMQSAMVHVGCRTEGWTFFKSFDYPRFNEGSLQAAVCSTGTLHVLQNALTLPLRYDAASFDFRLIEADLHPQACQEIV